MNCKPNDLAMVIRSQYPAMLGRIITVKHLVQLPAENEVVLAWQYEGELTRPDGVRITFAEDCCLKPIRDPGDDAVDEMVQLMGEATARTA